MNQGQRMAYEEIGIKQYRFVAALSELTCDRCGSLDGSVFDTDKAVEGENFPPIHPRCRCVTIMADVNLTSRIARDPLTGENYKVDGGMTFDEWKSGLTDEQRNALKYVANSEKRGIIEMKRKKNDNKSETMPKKQLQKIIKRFKKLGGTIQMSEETDKYLDSKFAEAITYDAHTILLRQKPSRASVFEELIHSAQYGTGKNDGSYISRLKCEIEAQEKLLRYQKAYRLTKIEVEQTEKALNDYKNELKLYYKKGGV